jgi:cytochrome b6-f complex iron-sulfur subunit
MNRREFITWVGIGGIASSLPLALAACSPKSTESESSASPSRPDGFQSVGTTSELSKKGYILNKEISTSGVLVVSQSSDSKTITAVNPTCTHRGCTVEWKAQEKSFVCPCHGAKFSADGKVLEEPAQKPLPTYEVKTQGDLILVKTNA